MKRISFLVGLVVISLFYAAEAMAFENSPIGWASYNDLGNNGTTGGAGGPTVTVSDEPNLVKYASDATTGPYIVQVEGIITLTDRVDVSANKTIIGIGTDP